jgi:WD40 repeat protein
VTGPVVLSPDGRFVASSATGGLVIYPVDGGSPIDVPGDPETGKLVRWSSDPDVLFVLEQDGAGATVYKRNITTGDRSFFREVRVPDPAGVTRFDLWLSRDGETYVYTLDRWLSNLFVIENLP